MLNCELNNGRLAMVAVMGMIAQEYLTGHPGIRVVYLDDIVYRWNLIVEYISELAGCSTLNFVIVVFSAFSPSYITSSSSCTSPPRYIVVGS